MYIYKITNDINGKIYIGQTIKTVKERFSRHIGDCIRLDTHLARAMRKYGPKHFHVETIDTAENQDELNKKEQYWIRYYNSMKEGYNETDAIYKSGGNTYQSKNKEEMEIIKEKIRQTKLGGKNPMAKKIKAINIETGEVYIYDTIVSCARERFGSEAKRSCIIHRLRGRCTSPYLGKWMFEYYNE